MLPLQRSVGRALTIAVVLCACAFHTPEGPRVAAASAEREPLAGPALPACIHYNGEARSRNLGYDHVVHIRSECTATAQCLVATNVDPQPVEAAVPANREVEVVTRVGSPAREFVPVVSCTLQ